MEKKFNEQDSFNLINEMILQAKNNIRKGAADSTIFCGYTVAIVAILNYILLNVLDKPHQSFWIWLLMIPMTIGTFFIDRKKEKSSMVKTHIDKIVWSIWRAFVICVVLLLGTVFGFVYIMQSWSLTIMFTPLFLLLMGLGQFVTATTCRFRPYYFGAYVFWLGVILCVISLSIWLRSDVQFIILALCMIFGFCIPGHIINRKAEQHV